MVPLDRVKAVAVLAIQRATDAIALWAPSEYPRRPSDASDIITARLARLETGRLRTGYVDDPTEVLWTAPAAPTASALVGISIAGCRFTASADADPTPTELRDVLFSEISNGLRLVPGVTAVTAGADGITLTGTPGSLYRPCVVGAGTVSVVSSVESQEALGLARGVLEFEAYAGGADGRAGSGPEAFELIARVASALSSQDVLQERERLGVAFNGPMGDAVDLTAQAGPRWESRAAARLPVSLRSYRAIPIGTIESAQISSITIEAGGETITTETEEVTLP